MGGEVESVNLRQHHLPFYLLCGCSSLCVCVCVCEARNNNTIIFSMFILLLERSEKERMVQTS